MATLANLRTVISSKLGLDNSSGSSEQQLIDGWVNEAIEDILLRTRVKIQSAVVSLTNNVGDYTLDSNILTITEIYATSANQDWQLERVMPDEVLRMRRASNVTGTPLRYYAVNGANLLMLYPAAQTGDTITVYYVPRHTTLTSGTDDPTNQGIPHEYHKVIEYYGLWQGADYDDDSTSQAGEYYRKLYEAKLKDMRHELRHKGGRRLNRVIPGRLQRRSVPPTPSSDFR